MHTCPELELAPVVTQLTVSRTGQAPLHPVEEVNSRNTGLRPKTHTHLGESDPTKDKNNVNQTRAPHGPAPNMKNMQPAQTRPTRRERPGNQHCLL